MAALLLREPGKTWRGHAAQSIWKKRKGKSRLEMVHSFFFKKKKRQQNLCTETEDIFHVHTEPTWALTPGWIRDKGSVFRVIAASRLIFLANGSHLFKGKMILFKTSWKLWVGRGIRKEKDEAIHKAKTLQREKDLKNPKKGNRVTTLCGQLPGCSYTWGT